MKTKKMIIFVCLVMLITIICIEPAFAGPGGKIARVFFETFWGKIILLILTIIFLPFIIYMFIKEKIAERRARKDLRYVSLFDPNFEWLRLKERVLDCFYRIHAAWSQEAVSELSEFMTSWYCQNQQTVFLDRWKREGLKNHCEIKGVSDIRPLLFVHRNDDDTLHEGSMVVVSITANMKDYLAERKTGKVIEGSKKFKDVETIWSFTMTDGKWQVSNIEEDTYSLAYAKLVAELPDIKDTIINIDKKAALKKNP